MQANQRFSGGCGSERGGVLVLALVAVGVVALLSVTYLQLSANITRRQVAAVDTKVAFYLAEAGLAEGYTGLMVGHTGSVGTAEAPALHGEGVFWVEATELSDDLVELQATGLAKSGKAVLGLVVRRGTQNTGALGIFSENDLVVPDGSAIDGYDSAGGAYAAQAAADPESIQHARVGSNGNVTVIESGGATAILGDVFAGPGGAVLTTGAPTITGTSGTSAGPVELAEVRAPDVTMAAGIEQLAGAPLVVPSGTFGADFLRLASDAEVLLQGPLRLVLGDLSLDGGAELVCDTTDGPIEIYVAGAVDLDPAAVFSNTSEDPGRLTLNVASETTVAFTGAGAFHGLVYAPEGTVEVGTGFELFGGIVAETLALAGGARLHYDERLVESGAHEALPKVVSWRILDLPQGLTASVGTDPFAALGVSPSALARPSQAHEDQNLSILYLNTMLLPGTYNGLESAFDWAQVRQVLYLKRTGGMVETDLVQVVVGGGLGILGL